MRLKIAAILFIGLCVSVKTFAQTCSTFGQTPSTAFPLCGVDTFHQNSVPLCSNGNVTPTACEGDGSPYPDKNPFWYKFTCYTAGYLSFTIVPNDLNDDYDWELFDVTGHPNLNDVYTDVSLFVSANFAGTLGETGASLSATANVQCASDPSGNVPTFSKSPLLQPGHNYLLLISHYTSTQSGYSLIFSDLNAPGSPAAGITDTTSPRLSSALANCNGQQITLALNKSMQCSSLAVNGSDFSILPGKAFPISASGINCSNGFDMDSVTILLNQPLPPGNYFIVAKNGIDQNTLLDNCNAPIPVGDSIPVTILPQTPTPMDSITPVACSPDTLQLVFERTLQCSSIAGDGSDFSVTGPYPIVVKSASGNSCNNGLTNIIDVVLTSPIVHAGTYNITLKQGSDGNTIIDECEEQTPAGQFLNFAGFDTVSAAFTYNIFLGCKYDSIQFNHDGRNNVNQWEWIFDNTDTSYLQNPLQVYTVYGQKTAQLLVSNGVCTDTASVSILLGNYLKALFQGPSVLCPNDDANFTDSSIGQVTSWYWNFGDGNYYSQQEPPPQSYPITSSRNGQLYPVELIVENNLNCFDTAINQLQVLYNCYIAVPSAFTPNNDGLNDYLYPLNAYKAQNLQFSVYDRLGQLVFHTNNWTIKWDGTYNNIPQASGTYVWVLTYTDGDTGKKVFQKGTSVLIR